MPQFCLRNSSNLWKAFKREEEMKQPRRQKWQHRLKLAAKSTANAA